MMLKDILEHTSKPIFTCEIVPPQKGANMADFWKNVEELVQWRPGCIDITYHRSQIVFADGCEKKSRERPGTLGIAGAIWNKYKIPPVPHIVCGSLDWESTSDILFDAYFLGIENILLLQGDKGKHEEFFTPSPQGYTHASELVQKVVQMKQEYGWNFCIGVAGYPEKHRLAPSMEYDLQMLQHKMSMGADYIVTQMFFDNQKYFDFVAQCRKMGITAPILPGLKPITTKKQITLLPKAFSVSLPSELRSELEKASEDEIVEEIGINWCIKQSKELLAHNVPCIHLYTMSQAEPTCRILKNIF